MQSDGRYLDQRDILPNKNKNPQYKQEKSKDAQRQGNNNKEEKQANNNISNLGIMLSGDVISVQSLSYNYDKFLKNEV